MNINPSRQRLLLPAWPEQSGGGAHSLRVVTGT